MAKNNGLGRGLDSLIPASLNVEDVATPGESVKQVSLGKLVANPGQPRKSFDKGALQELAESIKQHGVIQPVIVTPHSIEGQYRIVAGERRFRAAGLANIGKLPVIIRDHKELEELEIALVENVQRVDLSPLEQAVSIVRLHDQFSMSFKDIAKKLGKAETTISNTIRLLQLPAEAVKAMQKNLISEGHARAILALRTDKKAQKELLNTIITHKLSVRSAEDFVQNRKKSTLSTPKHRKTSPEVIKMIDRLPINIAKRINVRQSSGQGGVVSISYENNQQLKDVLQATKQL